MSRAGWRAGVGGFVGAAFWRGGVVGLGGRRLGWGVWSENIGFGTVD